MDGRRGRGVAAEAIGIAGLLASFLFGGMSYGLAVAVFVGGGAVGALVVGFFALPLAFGLGMTAWRSILGAWLVAHLARSAVRSRGDEARFREELKGTLAGLRRDGPASLPGTWVFVPIAGAVGLVGALAMALLAEGGRLVAAALILAGCLAVGILMRRLARQGRLPIPEE